MRRLSLVLFLALAACAPVMTGHRRADTPITSLATFDLQDMAGVWHEVAAIERPVGALWSISVAQGGALRVETSQDGTGQGHSTGPGRFALSSFSAPLWVLWADADRRTLVLGTPNGSFASVLDRARAIPSDRLQAARDILAWNGYDLGALH